MIAKEKMNWPRSTTQLWHKQFQPMQFIVCIQLKRLLHVHESYSPPPVGGVVRSISIAGGVDDVVDDVIADVVKGAVEDAVDDAVDDMAGGVVEEAVDSVVDVEEVVVNVEEVVVDVEEVVVDVEEVVVDVEGNVADVVHDGISEEDDVDVAFVEVVVACVDAGATHVLVDADAMWVTKG